MSPEGRLGAIRGTLLMAEPFQLNPSSSFYLQVLRFPNQLRVSSHMDALEDHRAVKRDPKTTVPAWS